MPRKKRKDVDDVEANMLPVMSVMFLLIPALLLAMEVASMAAIYVAPPKFSANPSETPPEKPEQEPLKLKVFILEDGFRVSAAGQQEGAEAGREADSTRPTIPLKKPNAALTDYERFDYAALEAKAAEYKMNYKHETVVTVSAENTIPMQVLISTMDAMRGTSCRMIAAMQAGEEPPPDCLFWQPVIEAGAG